MEGHTDGRHKNTTPLALCNGGRGIKMPDQETNVRDTQQSF